MLIDWFTIAAQALNFLILVWLMKRFLYKPILHALDAREQRIAKELAEADAKKREAEEEREKFRKKNEAFDQQRDDLLSEAKREAKGERERLLDEARQAADALRAKRQETLRNDAHNLNQAISRRTQKEVFAIARKMMADLAGTTLDERMSEVFTGRLRRLEGEAKQDLATALNTSSDPLLVRSAFALPSEQQGAIQNALQEAFSADSSTQLRAGIRVRFETAPDLISGIELIANGRKVAWSMSDYLSSLEKSVGELLKDQSKPRKRDEGKAEPSFEKTEPETMSR
jgi:F-type H+-transporting ATPase subunit b